AVPVARTERDQSGRAQLGLLMTLIQELAGSLELDDVLRSSLRAIRHVLDVRGGSIALVRDGHLVLAAADPPPRPDAAPDRPSLDEGFAGRAVATGRPVYSSSALAVPIMAAQG